MDVSAGFVKRYKLKVDFNDVAQYFRINIYDILIEKYSYVPIKDDSSEHSSLRFSKYVCNVLKKRFLQEYFYKKNMVNNGGNFRAISNGFPTGNEYELVGVCSNSIDYTISKNFITDRWDSVDIVDRRIVDPCETMAVEQHVVNIQKVLTNSEYEVFNFMVDDSSSYTQDDMASLMGISQPMISRIVSSIRNKVSDYFTSL